MFKANYCYYYCFYYCCYCYYYYYYYYYCVAITRLDYVSRDVKKSLQLTYM